ncbi:hotdog domain-containing protein [Streptomyces sp. NPDC090075]|uniref:PaaI family thioesterase n=1 Tax=Streptomyces sp. NPDC090075 TaxID=3365937 RepID=UPI0037FF3627
MISDAQATTPRRHLLSELGFGIRSVGEELHGTAVVTPEMHVPGTAHLRTSVLATWADTLIGLLATRTMAPRVPVTLELEVHLYRPAPATGTVRSIARIVRAGRSVFVAGAEFTQDDGEPLAVASGSFMASPYPGSLPALQSIDVPPQEQRLSMPLAERAGCERRGPGEAVLPRSEDGLNASDSINGGLIALAAEEALLSLAPGSTLCSLGLRYVQAARVGPLVATATMHSGLGQLELRDTGNGHRLTGTATGRAVTDSGWSQ